MDLNLFFSFLFGIIIGIVVGIAWISRRDVQMLMKKNICKENYRLIRLGSHDPRTSIYRKIIWGNAL